MGLNAQTAVPTFTAGQVLTAAEMNQSARTGVPVFATSVERDAAFGGAGEKTLAEGQLCYLEDTNVVQYYDGAAWATLGPTSPGLTFLTGTSFSAVTSFSLPNSTFTSSYVNYRLIVRVTALTADADFTMRMRASGTDNSSGQYNTMLVGIASSGVATNATADSATSWNVGELDAGIPGYSLVMDVINPQVATYTACHGTISMVNKAGNASIGRAGSWWMNNTGSFDSLSFISSVASSITGTYRVYGYN